MQNKNIAWWNGMMEFLQNKVSDALENELIDYSLILDKVSENEINIQKPISCVFYQTN